MIDLYRYHKSKEIFDIIGPHEYGIEKEEKLLIGFRNTLPLMKKLLSDLESATTTDNPFTRLYFTKESKVYCLLNAILLSGLKVKIVPTDIPELDCILN
jgi:inositol-hexakisphosphate/diphosphoinositol-pentakisphosphate 1-kinase